ncbi:sulfite exporter TauE/SafE family protein [Xylanimonas protaetiae]|uniref:Probable membrane transporter protein n=1 Tax=Xylanimonas protaetiae TaxID=2509457 RepID=A0A4P6F7H7_9MICO|nr:sulfite exporter TauE/SafE family protein [Xylanimonas protaetiae]
MIDALPWTGWAVAVLVALLVGFSKTALGGLGLIAAALMALVVPARDSTGAVLLLLVTGDLVAIWAYRKHADFRVIGRLLGPVIVGVALGAVFLGAVSDQVMRRTIGAILLVLLLLNLGRNRLRADSRTAAAGYGGLAGFTTMVANAGGPPMSLYLLATGFEKWRFLGTTAWFFFTVNVIKLPVAVGVGIVRADTVALWAVLAPVVLVGTWIGRKVVGRVDQRLFDRLVTVLVVVASLNLLLL